jgi:hypothetical protein
MNNNKRNFMIYPNRSDVQLGSSRLIFRIDAEKSWDGVVHGSDLCSLGDPQQVQPASYPFTYWPGWYLGVQGIRPKF